MPSQISRHHKKPSIRAFSVYTFQSSFKKSISITPTKRANRSSYSLVRMFNGSSVPFVSFASLTSQLFRSFVCACRSRVSHRYTRLALRAMLASLTLIHSLIHFASLLRSLTHSTHFHVRPLSHASRICQGFLLAISTIRVASRVRDK